MRYRTIGKTGIEASVLGFGCMRFPIIDDDSSKIDIPKAKEMLRYAIDKGVNYIDTAYPYHGGTSEAFVGEALSDGYRDKVTLITKSPSWLIETEDDFEKYLDEQLKRLKTSCIDIYLLHALNAKSWANYQKVNVFKAIEKAKLEGKIKHIGFSFHDEYPVFKEIIDAYKWDVCMIQLNYMDTEEQAGMKGLLYAESKDIPVIVMEPLKGGMLASPSEEIAAIWKKETPNRSPIEWALRYLMHFPNVKVVLSGMSTMEQLLENLDISDRLEEGAMTESQLKTVEEVKIAYASKIKVKCTQCEYCMPCPFGVEIPKSFTYLNRANIYNAFEAIKGQYNSMIKEEGKASKCVACGACEPKCPQSIPIIASLKEVVEAFGS